MKWIIGFNITQIRKLEKIFRQFGRPFFTDGTGDYSTFDGSNLRLHNSKYYVWLDQLRDNIVGDQNLRQALKDEFSNVDIPDWIDANKELYSILKN
mgnify:CR=1 FL=1|tara:strand:+ start:4092 stop:4379 length:288 start_codon:yes stop_codon:yes gene_type:complete